MQLSCLAGEGDEKGKKKERYQEKVEKVEKRRKEERTGGKAGQMCSRVN